MGKVVVVKKKGKKRGFWPLALLAGLLAVNSTWAAAPVAMNPNLVEVTEAYTMDGSYEMVLVDDAAGAVTVTLPAASAVRGHRYVIKKIGANANSVTIATAGSDKIDAVMATMALATAGLGIELVSDGQTGFWRIGYQSLTVTTTTGTTSTTTTTTSSTTTTT